MTPSRALVPAERMVDVFDRASTLNFTTIVTVKGPLDEKELDAALRAVEQRHPLLRARYDRKRTRFVYGEAAPITLRWLDAPKEEIDAFAEASLSHRLWADDGPRAEVTLLKHALGHATLLVTLHHLVSDGSSGIIVARDILRALAGTLPGGEVPSPGQNAFFPEGRGGAKDLYLALSAMAKNAGIKPFRLKPERFVAPKERHVRLHAVDLTAEETTRLLARARRASCTAHGVLVSALGRAVAAEGAGERTLRVLHPIDFRRMLDGKTEKKIGDAVGYYVSSVETDFVVNGTELEPLARSISTEVHRKRAEGEPFLSAPSAGKLAVWLGGLLSTERFRETAERSLLPNTFALTNLGRLETLGLEKEMGQLTVLRASFVAAGSVVGTLFASATCFDDALSLRIGACEPTIAPETAKRIVARVRDDLTAYVNA
jgi:NRPS condensation-like uncharacterized protein